MSQLFHLLQAEWRKQWLTHKSYLTEIVADQLFFILGFLILSGLFELATEGQQTRFAQLAGLLGYAVWRIAGGCITGITTSLAYDAQWGTLEQVWLSGSSPFLLLLGRSMTLVVYYTMRVLIIVIVIWPILHLPVAFSMMVIPGALFIYLLTLSGAFGLALFLGGLHLVYKNVDAITFPMATLLLFLTGALTPLDGIPFLYPLSRFLPLSIGIDLLRDLLVEGQSILLVMNSPLLMGLIINSTLYLVVGWSVCFWATRKALIHGSLAHY